MKFNLFSSLEKRDQKNYGPLLTVAEARSKLQHLAPDIRLEELTDRDGDKIPFRKESDPESVYHDQAFRLTVNHFNKAVVGVFYHQCLVSNREEDSVGRYTQFLPSKPERIPLESRIG